MITPRFSLSQTSDDIILTIHAPYANLAEAELYVNENDVRFHASPYYLRLNLPGSVEENDGSRAIYDVEKGDFVIKLGKMNPGYHFDDLEMITKLLGAKSSKEFSKKHLTPEVAIISTESDGNYGSEPEDNELQWFIEQIPEEEDSKLVNCITYGFANSKQSVFKKIESVIPNLVDLPDPDNTPESVREELRVQDELRTFNEGHYLEDLMDVHDKSSNLYSILRYKGPWETHPDEFATFSGEDLDVLKNLPNKEYIMNEKERLSSYLGIVDLIFSYAFERRSTEGEGSVESGWTMAKISPMLSWLQAFSKLDVLVTSCLRRSLCYPLYRNWDVSLKVLDDTKRILHMGKIAILKCLLHIYSVFNTTQSLYILNQLYIRDYCVWIQKASSKRIESLASALNEIFPKKEDLGLELKELEAVMSDSLKNNTRDKKLPPEVNLSINSVDNLEPLFSKMKIGVMEEAVSDSDDSTSEDGSYESSSENSETADDKSLTSSNADTSDSE